VAPYAISGNGNVTGYYIDQANNFHAFYRDASGTVSSFDGPGFTTPFGVNNAGVVVGVVSDSITGHSFIRTPDGTLTLVDPPNAVFSEARGINNRGAVAGFLSYSDIHYHGFLRKPGGAYTAIDYPGATGTEVFSFGPNGLIAGQYSDSAQVRHGFLYIPAACSGGDDGGDDE
ncbi:MAG: hypothetical protein JOZ43_08200, partial [Acidobacteriales bacterium]|nr:hypothetical protein [Terriglobales bacterium]